MNDGSSLRTISKCDLQEAWAKNYQGLQESQALLEIQGFLASQVQDLTLPDCNVRLLCPPVLKEISKQLSPSCGQLMGNILLAILTLCSDYL